MYAFNFSEQQHLKVEFVATLSALLQRISRQELTRKGGQTSHRRRRRWALP